MAVRTGADYVRALRDGREVWHAGRRIEDVTAHSGFTGTIKTLCDGAVTLAVIWEGAWIVGGGEGRFQPVDIKPMNKNSLRSRYEKTDFVESFDLDHIRPHLKGHP